MCTCGVPENDYNGLDLGFAIRVDYVWVCG